MEKAKNRITMWSSSPTSGYVSRKNSNPQRYMYPLCSQQHYFTINKTWTHPKCPVTDELVNVVDMSNGILNHRKNETVPFAATWTQLKIVMVSEGSQKETNFVIFVWNLK